MWWLRAQIDSRLSQRDPSETLAEGADTATLVSISESPPRSSNDNMTLSFARQQTNGIAVIYTSLANFVARVSHRHSNSSAEFFPGWAAGKTTTAFEMGGSRMETSEATTVLEKASWD